MTFKHFFDFLTIFCIFCDGIVELFDSPEIILHTQILRGVHPMKSFNFIDLVYRFLYWVCILNFGMSSVFEFSACGGMNGPTNLAVVDLSPYGFVFKELALQTLILHEFLSFLLFGYFVTNHFAHCRNHFAQRFLRDVRPGIKTGDDTMAVKQLKSKDIDK